MKTYEEMARSITGRAKAHRARRNRWIAGSVAAVCALGICLGAVAMRTNDPAPETLSVTQATVATTESNVVPTESTVAPTESTVAPMESTVPSNEDTARPRVTFLTSDGLETQAMEPNVTLPLASRFRVRNIRGMTQTEIEAVCQEEVEYAENLWDAHSDKKGYDWDQFPMKNVVITSSNAGHFILSIEDWEQLESVHVSVKGAIRLMFLPSDCTDAELMDLTELPYPVPMGYLLTGEDLESHYLDMYGGYEISWLPSNQLCRELNDTGKPISEYSDTVTFTVTFTDGTVETYDIDMIFNDSGEVYAMLRGITAAA